VEQYRRRDGSCVGGRGPAELLKADVHKLADEAPQGTGRIDSLFRYWAQRRRPATGAAEGNGEGLEGLAHRPAKHPAEPKAPAGFGYPPLP
jgi:hypothetical protein